MKSFFASGASSIHPRDRPPGVRVSEAFFAQLDEHFGFERGDDGQPWASDFLVAELPTIIERFAVDFDRLPQVIEGSRPAARLDPM